MYGADLEPAGMSGWVLKKRFAALDIVSPKDLMVSGLDRWVRMSFVCCKICVSAGTNTGMAV